MSNQDKNSSEQSSQDKMQEMPIVLNLTLRKVNYILGIMAQLPYEKAFQPINDIQQMVVAQVQAIQAQAQEEAESATESTTESTQ